MWDKYMARRIKSLSTLGLIIGEKLLDLSKRNRLMTKKIIEVLFNSEIVD